MRYLLATLGASLCWLPAVAQTFFPDIKQLPIRAYDERERAQGSVRLPDLKIMVMGAEFALGPEQRYQRRPTGLGPRPVVYYQYSLPDSVVRRIGVEIDSSNFLGYAAARETYREPLGRYPQFLAAYQRIRQELEARLGKPTASQPAHKKKDDLSEGYEADDTWETPELKAYAFLTFTLATKPPVAGPAGSPILSVSTSPTYRIRVDIRYKNLAKPAARAATPAGNPQQAAVAKRFIDLLLAGKYAESWELLGPNIKQTLTLPQYTTTLRDFLAKQTGPEQGATLFMSGPSFAEGGQQYAVYYFKFNSDTGNPPNSVIAIIFKDFDTELIGGIQPRTRSTLVPATKP